MPSDSLIDIYRELPEDPELAFVEFEKLLQKTLNDFLSKPSLPSEEIRRAKHAYVDRVFAFHNAHDFQILEDPDLAYHEEYFEERFEAIQSKIRRITTEISIRHARRLRSINVIVQLTDDMRRQIQSYIGNIREIVQSTALPGLKKEAIFSKINALSDEIDRDRTKAEALTALTLEIASGVGSAAKQLEPAKKLLDSIGNVMAKAKELAERLGLSSPKSNPRLEPPKKQLPAPSGEDELDDGIPF